MSDPKKNPPPTAAAALPPKPTPPTGGGDFDKFVRSALDTMIVEGGAPLAPPPGLSVSLTPVPPPTAPPPVYGPASPAGRLPQQNLAPPPAPGAFRVSPADEEFREQQRAVLRQEEERLARLPRLAPIPSYAGTGPASFLTGASQPEIVAKDGYDPLHLRAFRFIRTLVAGGLIVPGALDPNEANRLMDDLRRAIEPTSKGAEPVTSATPPAANPVATG